MLKLVSCFIPTWPTDWRSWLFQVHLPLRSGESLRKERKKVLSSPDLVYILYIKFLFFSNFQGWKAITSALPTSLMRFVRWLIVRGLGTSNLPTMGLMLQFKGASCTLTVHMAGEVNHRSSTGAFSALYFRLRRSPLTLYIYYILNFQKSQNCLWLKVTKNNFNQFFWVKLNQNLTSFYKAILHHIQEQSEPTSKTCLVTEDNAY